MPAGYFHLFLLVSAVLLNTSCGFQLRGALDISDSISPLYLEQGSAFELAREINGLLVKNKIALADSAVMAKSRLTLVNESTSRRVLSVDGNGRAREYLLTYSVNITIKIQQEKETRDSITLSRSLVFDPDAVLAATNETEILYRDMRKDAARLVLLKLQARWDSKVAADEDKVVDDSIKVQKANSAGDNGSIQ